MPIRPEMRDRYPADWRLRSYFVRFVRARGRCEGCGAEHGKPHPVTGARVILTTAHVFDHRPEAAQPRATFAVTSFIGYFARISSSAEEADAIFREAMRVTGEPWWRRTLIWVGVRLFGYWPWETRSIELGK